MLTGSTISPNPHCYPRGCRSLIGSIADWWSSPAPVVAGFAAYSNLGKKESQTFLPHTTAHRGFSAERLVGAPSSTRCTPLRGSSQRRRGKILFSRIRCSHDEIGFHKSITGLTSPRRFLDRPRIGRNKRKITDITTQEEEARECQTLGHHKTERKFHARCKKPPH